MRGLSKKHCFVLLVLIFLMLLTTTLGVLFGFRVIGCKESDHSESGEIQEETLVDQVEVLLEIQKVRVLSNHCLN